MPSLPDLPSTMYSLGEKEKLPPPAALFGDYFPTSSAFQEGPRSPNVRPVYILPPLSSLQSYHMPPPPPPPLPSHASMPYFYPPATPSPSPSEPDYKRYQFAMTSDTADDQVNTHSHDKNKRKRRDTRKKQVQSPQSPPTYHYEVIDVPNKRSKHQKVESEAISAAAATLASFAHAPAPACQDGEDDACAGQGELACDQCDATYQHPVCLKRHRWEHADGWKDIQGRLSMSKQQQVQVLEAAQILMNIARCGIRVSVIN